MATKLSQIEFIFDRYFILSKAYGSPNGFSVVRVDRRRSWSRSRAPSRRMRAVDRARKSARGCRELRIRFRITASRSMKIRDVDANWEPANWFRECCGFQHLGGHVRSVRLENGEGGIGSRREISARMERLFPRYPDPRDSSDTGAGKATTCLRSLVCFSLRRSDAICTMTSEHPAARFQPTCLHMHLNLLPFGFDIYPVYKFENNSSDSQGALTSVSATVHLFALECWWYDCVR